jgi:hypothetical protein
MGAIQKLEKVLSEPTHPQFGDMGRDRDRDRNALLECVQTVTLAVAAEARELATQGIWTIVDVNREVEKFERAFAEELGKYERHGRVLPSLTKFSEPDRCDVLRPQVELDLHNTKKWRQHRAKLLALKPRPADSTTPAAPAKTSRRAELVTINGEKLREIREENGWKQKELGPVATVYRLENRLPVKPRSRNKVIGKLAELLSQKGPKVTFETLSAKLQSN